MIMTTIYNGKVNMTIEATPCCSHNGISVPRNCTYSSHLENGNCLPHNPIFSHNFDNTALPPKNLPHQQNGSPSSQHLQKGLIIQTNCFNHTQNCQHSPGLVNPHLPVQGFGEHLTMKIPPRHTYNQPGPSVNYLQQRPENSCQPVRCLPSQPVKQVERYQQSIDLQLSNPPSMNMLYQRLNSPLACQQIDYTQDDLPVNYPQSSCYLNHHQSCHYPHRTHEPQLKCSCDNSAQNTSYRSQLRRRTAFTMQQLLILEKAFKIDCFASVRRRLQLARELNLDEKTIKIWFQNRRTKDKKEQYDESPSFDITIRETNSRAVDNQANLAFCPETSSSRPCSLESSQELSSFKNQDIPNNNTNPQVLGDVSSSKCNQVFDVNIGKMPLKTPINNENLILERKEEELSDDVSMDESLLLSFATDELVDLGSEIIEDFLNRL